MDSPFKSISPSSLGIASLMTTFGRLMAHQKLMSETIALFLLPGVFFYYSVL